VDTITLVEHQIEDGQQLLDKLAQDGFEVVDAAWVKPVDEERWSLLLATPVLEIEGAALAYRKVYASLRSIGNVGITDSEIKLIGEKQQVALALKTLRHLEARMSTFSHPLLLGSIPVEQLHVYAVGDKSKLKHVDFNFRFIVPAETILDTARRMMTSTNPDEREVGKSVVKVTEASNKTKAALEDSAGDEKYDLAVYLDFNFGNSLEAAKRLVNSIDKEVRYVAETLIAQCKAVKNSKASVQAATQK